MVTWKNTSIKKTKPQRKKIKFFEETEKIRIHNVYKMDPIKIWNKI